MTVKRLSLVRRLPNLSQEEFAARWLGEHVTAARRLPALRGYTIDVVIDGRAPFDGLATVRFDSRIAAEAAFAEPDLAGELARTRDQFATSTEIVWVEEHVVVPYEGG